MQQGRIILCERILLLKKTQRCGKSTLSCVLLPLQQLAFCFKQCSTCSSYDRQKGVSTVFVHKMLLIYKIFYPTSDKLSH